MARVNGIRPKVNVERYVRIMFTRLFIFYTCLTDENELSFFQNINDANISKLRNIIKILTPGDSVHLRTCWATAYLRFDENGCNIYARPSFVIFRIIRRTEAIRTLQTHSYSLTNIKRLNPSVFVFLFVYESYDRNQRLGPIPFGKKRISCSERKPLIKINYVDIFRFNLKRNRTTIERAITTY